MSGAEVEYVWHAVPVPPGVAVTQVYGWLVCPRTGRVLIQEHDDGVCNLPGGSPEPQDADMSATLEREAFEENQVRIGAAAYLGYQLVLMPGLEPFAQVRMAGVITEFTPRAPDADGGRLYRRLMTSLASAPAVLGWGEPGAAQARAAAAAARRWGLRVDAPEPDGYED
jgi:8-oxo-dGTP diphosphatase